ncbi:MAG: hypothetical protein ACOH1T_07055 [Microbacteriaceae bacterium]
MSPLLLGSQLIGAAGDVASGLIAGIGTAVILVTALLTAGLFLLFRRRDGARSSSANGLGSLHTRANVLLVRADEAVKSGDEELGFAMAQFGAERSREFGVAVAKSRGAVSTAFRLRHDLDDAFPESEQKQRELTLQIIALCESAIASLDAHDRTFSALRTEEVGAPDRVEGVRTGIRLARDRVDSATATLARLSVAYAPHLIGDCATASTDAAALLDASQSTLDGAESAISPAGVNAVASQLSSAEADLHRATVRLDALDERAVQLDESTMALATLISRTRADLTEARQQREAAPDPDTREAIIDAIARVEKAQSVVSVAATPADPISSLDTLGGAVAQLDAALASARNQAERLEHARSALGGALASATSQLSSVSAFITVGGRRVGADARTRLKQAERELEAARATGADPVEALDAARRAATHLRDADALAHYDAAN